MDQGRRTAVQPFVSPCALSLPMVTHEPFRCGGSAIRALLVFGVFLVAGGPVAAQGTAHPGRTRRVLAGALLLATSALDARIRDAAAANHSWALDRLAGTVDPFGRAKYLVPSLVAASLLPRALRQTLLANAALRVGIGYAGADAVESVLKPLVGRHRPTDGRGPWRFHPLSGEDAWHSLPSAHTVHAFSIAAGIVSETPSPVLHATAYGIAALVGLQRVYRHDHWGSDVVGSGMLAEAVSTGVVHWLRGHGLGPLPPVAAPRDRNDQQPAPGLLLGVRPGALWLALSF